MTTATSQGEAHEVAKENKKAIQARNLRTGVLFTAPALIVLAIFVFYPAIQTFITSLTNGRINSNARRPAKFIGFQNYITLFQSQDFWTDVKNTLVYAVLYAPIVVIIALAFALLLNRKDLKFVGFFRTCMFLPFVISLTVAAIAWQFILSPSLGLIPYWVSLLGGPSHLDLLGTRETSMATIVFITVFFDSLAAYGLSRVDFKGRGILLAVLIATMMIPAMALLIPVYKLLGSMGLVNSYLGIIIPRMADVGGIFLLRQFFISIPKDLDNAARIDGAGEFRIFAQIILPNAVPAILTVGMFNFMGNWNDLLWPLIMTSKPETRTITAGLAMLTGHGSSVTPYGVVMAGALISALPLLIVFFFVQKRFVEGIAMTGMK